MRTRGADTMRTRERLMRENFPEENIFRIDHFLGKEPGERMVGDDMELMLTARPWRDPHVTQAEIKVTSK